MVASSKNGYEIYINMINSHAGDYLNRRPYIITLIKEVLDGVELEGSRLIIEKDMGREIGTTDILKTDDSDYIYYAQALKTDVYSRFAKNRYPQQSRMLTMIFNQDDEGNYEIQDLWIGPSSPAFPGDEYETGNSKTYWQTHALAQNAKMIQSKSITKVCPY